MADAKQDVSNGPSHSSRVVLAKPRLAGFSSSGFGASSSSKSSSNPFGSLLRPAQLKPSTNPFLKVTDEKSEEKLVEQSKESENTENRLKEEPEAPKFMPLGSSNVTPRTSNPVPAPTQPASSAGFVFGQNLSERVVMAENVNNGDADLDHSATNGSKDSELLFTSAAANTAKENNQDEGGTSESGGGEGLAAAAAEYERSHARPLPPTSNCTMTGEEEEINVLQISCRLFAWEAGSWRERGRGVLRLNDSSDGGGARLVARVSGSLRVVLNTKLWPEMVVERAGTKSLRITAADQHQQVKLYLIMGAPGDIAQLNRALVSRVAISKKPLTAQKETPPSQAAAERLDTDYQDKAPSDDYDENYADDVTHRLQPDQIPETSGDSTENKLKRKEPVDEETSPKRQCPKILVE